MLEIFDAILIRLYLVTGSPLWDYFIGTFLLALLCVFVGHWTISLVFRVNRNHLKHLDDRLTTLNRLSATAEERQDRQSYKALNKEANDAYGHLFFNRFGLSAALLWPAVFALAWMQQRFAEIAIPIPLLGFKANYFVVFLVSYIFARIVFSRGRKVLFSLLGRCSASTKALASR